MWLGRADGATMTLDMRSALLAALLAGATCATAATFAAPVHAAHGQQPDRSRRAKAAKEFRHAMRAYRRHDYAAAAADFEEAYATLPHPAALFNAAEAYEKAGELTKAANLCARYLHDASDKDRRRSKANKMIADLTPKLGRVDIDANGAQDVQIDGKTPGPGVSFVDPGDHLVTGSFDGKQVQRQISVVAGSLEQVRLEAPPPPPARSATPVAAPVRGPRDQGAAGKHGGLPPLAVYIGAGATAVLGGVTIWSGLDTNKARSDYDAHPTQQGLDSGQGKQTRTNVLVGATAVVGVATAAIAIFATDWKGKSTSDEHPEAHMALGIGPGSVSLGGTFRGL